MAITHGKIHACAIHETTVYSGKNITGCRRPEPVTGDYKEALRPSFTQRVLTGLVAGVFDPLGLATPITAGFKLDLHQLCELLTVEG
jgi:hypothetical protein